MRLIFLAPPGAGKGTQGALICEEFKIKQLSTGDILREHKRLHTTLGKKARFYMDDGLLVPDEIIIEMLKMEIVKEEFSHGFLLDGFPRTRPQAEVLDVLLKNMGIELDAALILDVPRFELINRLSARRTCRKCNRSYHLIFNPPKEPDNCDYCDGNLFQRPDDTKETIVNRLKIFDTSTAPLINYYDGRGITRYIQGVGEVEEVFQRIKDALKK